MRCSLSGFKHNAIKFKTPVFAVAISFNKARSCSIDLALNLQALGFIE